MPATVVIATNLGIVSVEKLVTKANREEGKYA